MKKVLLPGIVVAIAIIVVGMAVGLLLHAIFPPLAEEMSNTTIYRAMDDPLMMWYFVALVVLAFVLAAIWNKIKTTIKGNVWRRGTIFGLLYFLIVVPGMIITYASYQVSFALVFSWTFTVFVYALVAGWILAAMNK